MRLTPSWLLAGLAFGLPAVMIALLSLASSGDGEGAGFLGLLVIVLSLFAFLGFGAWALVLARPGRSLGRVARRAGLTVTGLATLGYGLSVLFDGPGTQSFFIIGVFLITASAAAFYALVSDFLPKTSVDA